MINLHITIPKLSQQVIWDAEPGETVKSVINAILKSMNIPDPEFWNLFMLTDDFIQIPRETPCFDIAFQNATSFQLLQLETEPIEIFYKMKRARIAYDKFKPLSSVMEICMQIFNLSDQEQYLFMNPETYCVEAMHTPTKLQKLVLKPLQFKGKELVFPTPHFAEPTGLTSFPFISLSKTVISPQFKFFLTTLKSQFCEFNLINLSPEVIDSLFRKFELNSGLSEIPSDQQITMLFVILAQFDEPLIPREMIRSAKSIVNNENQFEVCQQLFMFLLMLPVSTHAIILELIMSLSGSYVHSPIKNEITILLQEILFKTTTEDEEEYLFIKYLLMFGIALLRLPGAKNICRIGDKIGFQSQLEHGTYFTINEKIVPTRTDELILDFDFTLFDKEEEDNRPIELHTQLSYLNASIQSFFSIVNEAKKKFRNPQ